MIRNPAGAIAWWATLTPDRSGGRNGDRAALARLRRCATIAEAMQEPATIELHRRCGAEHAADLPAVALAAATLAHLRRDRPGMPVARQIGPESPDRPETARLKPLRFRRLLEAETPEEAMPAFRRLLSLADGEANLRDLAHSLFRWTDQRHADKIRRDWIFAYWNADPVPAAEAPKEPAA